MAKKIKAKFDIPQAGITFAYNKKLSYEERIRDFLGKYHITYNGVRAHNPFMLEYEGQPNKRCDDDCKDEVVNFIQYLINEIDPSK